jgi:hypothetical protein
MTDPSRAPAPAGDDDWLDRALAESARDHAAAYVDDDGFTARVMRALPPRAALPAWRKPAVAALWAVAGVGLAYAVPGVAVDVAGETLRLLAAKPFALSEIAALLALAGAGMWTAAYLAWKS